MGLKTWVLGLLVVGGGAAAGAYYLGFSPTDIAEGVEGPPALVGQEFSWGNVNTEVTGILADLRVRNPNSFDLSFGTIEATFIANNIQVGMATTQSPVNLKSNSTVPVNVSIQFANDEVLRWWSTHLRRGETSTVEVNLTTPIQQGPIDETLQLGTKQQVNTDIKGEIENRVETSEAACPQKRESNHYHPPDQQNRPHSFHFPCIVDNTNHWDVSKSDKTVLRANFTIFNPNDYPVNFGDKKLVLHLQGVSLASGKLEERHTIPPKDTIEITVPAILDHSKAKKWWPKHVNGDCETSTGEVSLVFDFEGRDKEWTWSVKLPFEKDVSTGILC